MKKIVSILVILVLIIVMLPIGVIAAPNPTELVVTVDEDEYDILNGETPEGVTYDEDTNTLTLNNFEGCEVSASSMDLTIELKGESTLTSDSDSIIYMDLVDLTIKGDGILNIEGYGNNAITVCGKLIIDSGTINISEAGTALYLYGDLEFNGGKLNVEDTDYGIYQSFDDEYLELVENYDFPAEMTFLAKGGKININNPIYGIIIGNNFELAGTDILVSEYARQGFTNYGDTGYLKFNSGSLVFSSSEEASGEHFAFCAVREPDDETDIESLIEFDSDNLYIEDAKYDFNIFEVENKRFIIIAEEGFDAEHEETINKLATNVSILPKEKKTYEVTEGDGQKVYQSAKAIKIDADLDKFVALYINDELVDEDNYDLEEGSTIIKLKDSYVKKLEAGNYKFKAVFTDGEATGEFTVTTENPETGDSIIYTIILLGISVISLLSIKKRYNN